MSADNQNSLDNTQQLLDEAEALIWGLLDENIDAASTERLEKLLAHNEVRQRYVQCVELHSDLQHLFNDKQEKQQETPPKSPVLGSLSDSFPPIAFPIQPGLNSLPPLSE